MLFGVPDEITDMTRSLEMVERYRFIYRTIVFGYQKCSGVTGYVSGHRKGFRATPGKLHGPYGPRGETHQSQRGWCAPPIWAGQIGVEKGKEERKKGIGFPHFLSYSK